MAAPTYSSAVKIRSFTDENQYPPKKWTVQGVKGGSKIDEVTDIVSEAVMESTFEAYKTAAQGGLYDQVTVFEYTVNTPNVL